MLSKLYLEVARYGKLSNDLINWRGCGYAVVELAGR